MTIQIRMIAMGMNVDRRFVSVSIGTPEAQSSVVHLRKSDGGWVSGETMVIAGNWLIYWSDFRLLSDQVRFLGVGEVWEYMHTPISGQ